MTWGSEITGGIIGVQIKGGKTFFQKGRWVIPATPKDWIYWRSSTVPIIGMVHDPDTGLIRWINLSQLARSWPAAGSSSTAMTLLCSPMSWRRWSSPKFSMTNT